MDLEEFRKNYSILIVDDNEDNVFTLQNRLQREGFLNLSSAKDGLQAVNMVEAKHIDLILLDIMMPVMDGFEVLKVLKEQIGSQKLHVLMITLADNVENITECIRLGADDFLPKPFNPQILKARIGSCIEKAWHAYLENQLYEQIQKEKTRYMELLYSVFPPSVAKELTEMNVVKPKNISNVAVLFADIVSFTAFTEKHEAKEVVEGLQNFVEICEEQASRFHLEKIKTIGDAFLATAGMLEKVENPVRACVEWASEVISQMATKSTSKWQIRVGIDFGDITCGIIGKREYLFDLWGQCVNMAARIVDAAKPSTIFVSEKAWEQIAKQIPGSLAGEFALKGREGMSKLYQVELIKKGS